MTDPMILVAFVVIYLATGIGLLAMAGGFATPRLALAKSKSRLPQKRTDQD